MVGVTAFFPLLAIFLAMVTDFILETSLTGAVSTVAWVGWGSSRLRGFNPTVVMLVDPILEGGTRYQTGNSNDMLGNTNVTKTC